LFGKIHVVNSAHKLSGRWTETTSCRYEERSKSFEPQYIRENCLLSVPQLKVPSLRIRVSKC